MQVLFNPPAPFLEFQGCDTARATRDRTDVRRASAARANQTPAPERRHVVRDRPVAPEAASRRC